MRLSKGTIFANLCQALADGRVVWIIDVDVRTRARIGSFNLLVAVTLFLLLERNLDGLFLKQAALDILTLLLVNLVVVGAGVLQIGLLGERGIQLILPEVTASCRTHEGVQILASIGARIEL